MNSKISLALLHDSRIGQHPVQRIEGGLEELYRIGFFIGRAEGKEVISKRKDCSRQGHLPIGEGLGVLLGG